MRKLYSIVINIAVVASGVAGGILIAKAVDNKMNSNDTDRQVGE